MFEMRILQAQKQSLRKNLTKKYHTVTFIRTTEVFVFIVEDYFSAPLRTRLLII